MRSDELQLYIEDASNRGLTKIETTIEADEFSTAFCVTKTKETYVFSDEDEADKKIDEVRRDGGFIGVDKKFKAGKVSKSGEITRPDAWIVVVKLAH